MAATVPVEVEALTDESASYYDDLLEHWRLTASFGEDQPVELLEGWIASALPGTRRGEYRLVTGDVDDDACAGIAEGFDTGSPTVSGIEAVELIAVEYPGVCQRLWAAVVGWEATLRHVEALEPNERLYELSEGRAPIKIALVDHAPTDAMGDNPDSWRALMATSLWLASGLNPEDDDSEGFLTVLYDDPTPPVTLLSAPYCARPPAEELVGKVLMPVKCPAPPDPGVCTGLSLHGSLTRIRTVTAPADEQQPPPSLLAKAAAGLCAAAQHAEAVDRATFVPPPGTILDRHIWELVWAAPGGDTGMRRRRNR